MADVGFVNENVEGSDPSWDREMGIVPAINHSMRILDDKGKVIAEFQVHPRMADGQNTKHIHVIFENGVEVPVEFRRGKWVKISEN